MSKIEELAVDARSVVDLVIDGRSKDLGGFSVRRLLPFSKKQMVGPWIFFDHMGPAKFPPGQGIDVRPHPHINLATVTYLFEGTILHRDSLGSIQSINPGDLNLMVAGSGIVHSERTAAELRNQPHTLHGLQLWLALPAEWEETDPGFYHYPAKDIPDIKVNDVLVRVMMGSAYGVTSPVKCFSETLYFEARLLPGQSIELPEVEERAVYVAKGTLDISGTLVPEYSMAVMNRSRTVVVTAKEESFIALIGGTSLGERHIFWNFVSSRSERIAQAKLDWKNGRFPKVSGDDLEFIPLPG